MTSLLSPVLDSTISHDHDQQRRYLDSDLADDAQQLASLPDPFSTASTSTSPTGGGGGASSTPNINIMKANPHRRARSGTTASLSLSLTLSPAQSTSTITTALSTPTTSVPPSPSLTQQRIGFGTGGGNGNGSSTNASANGDGIAGRALPDLGAPPHPQQPAHSKPTSASSASSPSSTSSSSQPTKRNGPSAHPKSKRSQDTNQKPSSSSSSSRHLLPQQQEQQEQQMRALASLSLAPVSSAGFPLGHQGQQVYSPLSMSQHQQAFAFDNHSHPAPTLGSGAIPPSLWMSQFIPGPSGPAVVNALPNPFQGEEDAAGNGVQQYGSATHSGSRSRSGSTANGAPGGSGVNLSHPYPSQPMHQYPQHPHQSSGQQNGGAGFGGQPPFAVPNSQFQNPHQSQQQQHHALLPLHEQQYLQQYQQQLLQQQAQQAQYPYPQHQQQQQQQQPRQRQPHPPSSSTSTGSSYTNPSLFSSTTMSSGQRSSATSVSLASGSGLAFGAGASGVGASAVSPSASALSDLLQDDLFVPSSNKRKGKQMNAAGHRSRTASVSSSSHPFARTSEGGGDERGDGEEGVEELSKEDPLATQVWRMYARTKAQLPHAQRMENLTWRMMALALRRKKQMEADEEALRALDLAQERERAQRRDGHLVDSPAFSSSSPEIGRRTPQPGREVEVDPSESQNGKSLASLFID